MICFICVNRVGRVLSEDELLALLNGDLIVPDREVCKHKEDITCSRKKYELKDGLCVPFLTKDGQTI